MNHPGRDAWLNGDRRNEKTGGLLFRNSNSGRKRSAQNSHRIVKIVLLLTLGVLAFSATLELSLRLVLGLGSPVLFVRDGQFGYFPKGEQRLHRFFSNISTNAFGMRSPPASRFKRNEQFRILMVGDSVPFGTTYVDQRNIFPELIRAHLNESASGRFTVLNAACPGWAPSNELGFLKARGLYGSDMVLLVYNTEDLAQAFTPYQESALFPLHNPASATGELWSRYLEPRLFQQLALVDPGSTSAHEPPSPAQEAKVMETIETTRKLVTSAGARFVILFSPAATQDVVRYSADWNQAVFRFKQWAGQMRVPVLDMTPIMSAHDPAAVYFDGIHLRPLGNHLVADAFVRWFRSDPKEQ